MRQHFEFQRKRLRSFAVRRCSRAGQNNRSNISSRQKPNSVATEIIAEYEKAGKVDEEVNELITYWHSQLDNFKVKTPSEEFNNMVNVWNAYQCFITFIWSRAASLIYWFGPQKRLRIQRHRSGYSGYHPPQPELAADKIRFMISAQVDNGGGLPLVKFNHNAGHEDTPDQPSYVQATGHPSYRADDALWLFPTVLKYISESGNKAFLDEVIPYANGGEDSVYNHLKRAIKFSMDRLGAHDMPAGLHADWNDCLRLGAKGESTFVAFQLYYALTVLKDMAVEKNDTDYVQVSSGRSG